jgi:hypothetical protein
MFILKRSSASVDGRKGRLGWAGNSLSNRGNLGRRYRVAEFYSG